MTKNITSYTEGNQAAKRHGIYSFEKDVNRGLQPFEIDSLQELRELARSEQGRMDLKIEVIARLSIIVRKAFTDMGESQGAGLWSSGVIGRAGTYIAELRRWLEIIPSDKRDDALDAAKLINGYRNAATPEQSEDTDAPNN